MLSLTPIEHVQGCICDCLRVIVTSVFTKQFLLRTILILSHNSLGPDWPAAWHVCSHDFPAGVAYQPDRVKREFGTLTNLDRSVLTTNEQTVKSAFALTRNITLWNRCGHSPPVASPLGVVVVLAVVVVVIVRVKCRHKVATLIVIVVGGNTVFCSISFVGYIIGEMGWG